METRHQQYRRNWAWVGLAAASFLALAAFGWQDCVERHAACEQGQAELHKVVTAAQPAHAGQGTPPLHTSTDAYVGQGADRSMAPLARRKPSEDS